MSHSTPPPMIPDPAEGEGVRKYPFPVPQGGIYPAEATGMEPPSEAATDEEAEVRRRDEEHRAQQDLIDLIVEDRLGIHALLGQLREGQTPPQRRRELAEVTVAELSRQLALERRYLVPLVDAELAGPDGDEQRGELAELEELIGRLHARVDGSDADGSDQELIELAGSLADRLDRRAEAQERHLFPRLRQACDSQRLRELAQRARAAKDTAPTRPHPRAPDRPPYSAVTDPVVGAADRIRDEVTGRPTDPYDIG